MREYNIDDFTNTSPDWEEPIYVCNGCGYVHFDLTNMQTDHYDTCSTESIDLENQRFNEGYYNQDEEEFIEDEEDYSTNPGDRE